MLTTKGKLKPKFTDRNIELQIILSANGIGEREFIF